MPDVADDIGMAEFLAILAIFGVGGYIVYSFLKKSTCIAKIGTVPGITGASQSQVCAANTAASKLKPGGATVWSCGSDYDYLQPCGKIVTEARHNFVNYLWPWSQPVNYTDVPVNCYTVKCGAAFTSGVSAATGGNLSTCLC